MKRTKFNKPIWLTLLSMGVLALFIFMGASTTEESVRKELKNPLYPVRSIILHTPYSALKFPGLLSN